MRALRLICRGRVGLGFWSEQWVDRADLLTRITRRLETASVGRAIDAHDTWQQERDLAVATGRWGWLDLRTLLEEHGQGRCLFRVTARHRLTPFGATAGAVVAVGVAASLLAGSVAAAAAAFAAAGLVAAARMGLQVAPGGCRRARHDRRGGPGTGDAVDGRGSRTGSCGGRRRRIGPRGDPHQPGRARLRRAGGQPAEVSGACAGSRSFSRRSAAAGVQAIVERAERLALLLDRAPPCFVPDVPVDGGAQPVIERHLRLPAQRAQFRGVEGVAAVVAGDGPPPA